MTFKVYCTVETFKGKTVWGDTTVAGGLLGRFAVGKRGEEKLTGLGGGGGEEQGGDIGFELGKCRKVEEFMDLGHF